MFTPEYACYVYVLSLKTQTLCTMIQGTESATISFLDVAGVRKHIPSTESCATLEIQSCCQKGLHQNFIPKDLPPT